MGRNDELRRRLIECTPETDAIICVIEEMSELTKVLTKRMRRPPNFNFNDIAMELAHVQLMCEIIRVTFGINTCDIDTYEFIALQKALDEKTSSFPPDKDSILFRRHIIGEHFVSSYPEIHTYDQKLAEAQKIMNEEEHKNWALQAFTADLDGYSGLKKMNIPEDLKCDAAIPIKSLEDIVRNQTGDAVRFLDKNGEVI